MNKPVHVKCKAKGNLNEEGVPRLTFQGYGGNAVNLSDYGFDHPVVYDIASMNTKQKQPIKYEHAETIGHTTSVRKVDNGSAVRGKGLASLPGEYTDKVTAGLKNGFPFEASMGLNGNIDNIDFHSKGSVVVNNQTHNAPIYVWYNTTQIEMTVTESGRDSDTSFEVLNKESRMRIKNSKPTEGKVDPKDAKKPEDVKSEGKVDNSKPDTDLETKVDNSKKEDKKPEDDVKVDNNTPSNVHDGLTANDVLVAMQLHQQYPDSLETIVAGIQNGDKLEHIKNGLELAKLNKNLPTPPKGNKGEVLAKNSTTFIRTCLSYGADPEVLEKRGFDKKLVENAFEQPNLTLTEILLEVANSQGGRFTGHSDVEAMCAHIKNAGYSTFDLPDFFVKVASEMKEQRWEIGAPFAPTVCKEGSNKDFRTVEKKRFKGGETWQQVGNDGRLENWTGQGQETYQTKLATYGAFFTLDRETVINDDQDVLNDMMAAMVEGAMIIPDIQLGTLMLKKAAAANTFWVNNDNSFASAALTRGNLSTRYKAIRKYLETKNDSKNVQVMLDDRWTLIVGPDYEEEAWELLKQDRVVQETGAATGTKTGSKNYWFGRLDLKVFPQMGNGSLYGGATQFIDDTTWLLWPSSARFAPYEITYLRGKKKPTIENVDMPSNMLGFATRGYWDVNINERERTAIARSKATA